MNKIVLALAFALTATIARSGEVSFESPNLGAVTATTQATSDSSTKVATTAFVQSQFSVPQTWSALNTYITTGPTIEINDTRSGTVSSDANSRIVSIIDIDSASILTGEQNLDSLYVEHIYSGAGTANAHRAIYGYLHTGAVATGTQWNLAVEGVSRDDYGMGGTLGSPTGVLQGIAGLAIAAGSSSYLEGLQGGEFDVALCATCSSRIKTGVTIVSGVGTPSGSDLAHGSLIDAGLNITRTTVNDVGFNEGILLGQGNGLWPVTATGSVIRSLDTGAKSAAYGIDFNGVTFSQYAWRSTGFAVNGSGSISTTSASNAGPIIMMQNPNGSIADRHNYAWAGSGAKLFLQSFTDALVWQSNVLEIDTQSNAVTLSGPIGLVVSTRPNNQSCTAGWTVADANYIYVCTATNTVKRATLSAF